MKFLLIWFFLCNFAMSFIGRITKNDKTEEAY